MSLALVTGGARRLGRALALELAAAGHDLAIHCHRSTIDAEATASDARALGVRAQVFAADLLDLDQAEGLIDRVRAIMGPISVLVNNASIFEHDDIHSASRDSWDRHMGSNLRAPLILSQRFAAQAAPVDRSGAAPLATGLIVNMVDQRVLKSSPEYLTYALAKAGLWEMTRMLAQALAPAIRVNAIGPGTTLQGTHQTAEAFAQKRSATPLERGADPEDVAQALRYLLSARAVTGQLICVDGGQHLAGHAPRIAAAH